MASQRRSVAVAAAGLCLAALAGCRGDPPAAGAGAVVLLTDGEGRPIGYKWSPWSRSVEHRTAVALGRVVRGSQRATACS